MIRILLLLLLPIFTVAQKQTVLSLTTDNYPSETSWCVFADSLYGCLLYTSPSPRDS